MVKTVQIYAIVAASAVLGLLGGSLWFAMAPRADDAYADCRTGSVAGGLGGIGGPFTLIGEDGATVTDRDVITKPSLVYFGYTFCPDVCPLDNARNAEASGLLAKMGYDVQPVFISVDPERDTPAVMKDYTGYMYPGMIGLTGSKDQIKAAAQAYRAYYNVHDDQGEFYPVDHSTFTYLALPQQGVVEIFRRDEVAEDMAHHVGCFLDKATV